ncbi:MAG: histidinol dehydrogenase, partial [Candidatus Omnitrophica bacterium]|nr:histidinol dehydrogenase [Candidatus Omnitrophota bacterium]
MRQVSSATLLNLWQHGRFDPEVEKRTKEIIDRVRNQGDRAVLSYTKRFDRARLSQLSVPQEMMNSSQKYLVGQIKTDLKKAWRRIEQYHQAQLPTGFVLKERGIKIEFQWQPVRRVGLYIPASQAPLVSSVLMTVVPAKVAGCPEII